jgi:hypothetical protein
LSVGILLVQPTESAISADKHCLFSPMKDKNRSQGQDDRS